MDSDESAGKASIPNLDTNPGVSMYGLAFAYKSDPLFKPTFITIGPIHHQNRGLQAKEHKERYLNYILKAGPATREDLTNDMERLENETRNSYPEKFPNISRKEFVEMMVLDGCFIVQLMRLYYNRSPGEQINDPIFTTRRMLPTIRRDLLLMENQLPLSMLNQLFQRTRTEGDEQSFEMLALKFFEPLKLERAFNYTPSDASRDCKHLLALFQLACLRNYSRPKDMTPQEDNNSFAQLSIPSIPILTTSGMRIKKNHDAKHLLDINLKGCTLRIPTLLINNNSIFVLRNLLAYELSSVDAPTYIASLALFYGSIVKNLNDLEVLKEAEVINKVATVTDEQVLNLMQVLLKDLSILHVDDFYLEEQIKNISNYFKSIWYNLHRLKRCCLLCPMLLCKRLYRLNCYILTEY